MLSCEFCKIFKNTFFYRTPLVTASINEKLWVKTLRGLINYVKIRSDMIHIECSLQNLQLTLSWPRSLSYRNKSIDLQSKSLNWFLYDRDLRHERVNAGKRLEKLQKNVINNKDVFKTQDCANQWTGFYITETSAMKELMLGKGWKITEKW